jgi:hypothetical protein
MSRQLTAVCSLFALALLAAPSAQAAAVQPFSVEVTLSQKALAQLTTLKEQVTISASYYARPNEAGKKIAELGRVNLGGDDLTYAPVPRKTMAVTGKSYKLSALRYTMPGTAAVLINVFSARKTYADNILDCDIFEGSFAEAAAAQPVRISCALISE